MICFTCLTVADPEPTQQLYSLDPEPTQELYSPDPAKEDRLQAAQALEARPKKAPICNTVACCFFQLSHGLNFVLLWRCTQALTLTHCRFVACRETKFCCVPSCTIQIF